MIISAGGLVGCTAARPGVATVSPSYSYLRDKPAPPAVASPLTDASPTIGPLDRDFADGSSVIRQTKALMLYTPLDAR